MNETWFLIRVLVNCWRMSGERIDWATAATAAAAVYERCFCANYYKQTVVCSQQQALGQLLSFIGTYLLLCDGSEIPNQLLSLLHLPLSRKQSLWGDLLLTFFSWYPFIFTSCTYTIDIIDPSSYLVLKSFQQKQRRRWYNYLLLLLCNDGGCRWWCCAVVVVEKVKSNLLCIITIIIFIVVVGIVLVLFFIRAEEDKFCFIIIIMAYYLYLLRIEWFLNPHDDEGFVRRSKICWRWWW